MPQYALRTARFPVNNPASWRPLSYPALAAKPALQGRPKIAFFDRASFAGPDLVGGAHGLHDLALFELPNSSDPAWASSAANLGLLRLRVSRLAQKPFGLSTA